MRNEALFLEIAQVIRDRPELHDQDSWAHHSECGTKMCIAGWAATLSGIAEFSLNRWYKNGLIITNVYSFMLDNVGALLGLNDDEAWCLFHGAAAPAPGMDWPDALTKIAGGADLGEVIIHKENDDA